MDKTQRGVALGMGSALLVGVCGLLVGAALTPADLVDSATIHLRLTIAVAATLAPVITLLVCVARLAKHRFFTPEDINGSALTHGTDRARFLQALLQNTLEQAALALPIYFCCAVVFPSAYLGAVLAGGAMFFIGRISFFAGYANGAPARAFGFAFTFYPTVLLTVGTVWFLAMRGLVP